MVAGIEHVAIASPDTQSLAQWYVETLGFVIHSSSGKAFFIKAPDGSMIEIIVAEHPLKPKAMKDAAICHIALAVKDFESAYGQLRAKGVRFASEPILTPEVKVVFFTDPEGNYLHLIQRLEPLA